MSSKETILETAINVFAEKGKYGARQEEIAEKTGINKAMLYYYFTNKENLFREALYKVQKTIYDEVETNLINILSSQDSSEDKMRQFVGMHFKVFSKNKNYTKLYLQALANEPVLFQKTFSQVVASSDRTHVDARSIFEQGIKDNVFRDVDFTQTVISIIGMNLFYFIAKPISEVILNASIEKEEEFLSERLESITELLMHGIMKS